MSNHLPAMAISVTLWGLLSTEAEFAWSASNTAKIELTCVDAQATGYGTFQSHNQKVVANQRGFFMTHIRTRNEAYTAQRWRLSWSRDERIQTGNICAVTYFVAIRYVLKTCDRRSWV